MEEGVGTGDLDDARQAPEQGNHGSGIGDGSWESKDAQALEVVANLMRREVAGLLVTGLAELGPFSRAKTLTREKDPVLPGGVGWAHLESEIFPESRSKDDVASTPNRLGELRLLQHPSIWMAWMPPGCRIPAAVVGSTQRGRAALSPKSGTARQLIITRASMPPATYSAPLGGATRHDLALRIESIVTYNLAKEPKCGLGSRGNSNRQPESRALRRPRLPGFVSG
ncbi:hypothetical protein VUR80DRAFT_9979 [Thermomyces stellatus]